MSMRFELSPPKLTQTLDWYWQHGVRRVKDYPNTFSPAALGSTRSTRSQQRADQHPQIERP